LARLYVAAEGAGLRAEERKKARELPGLFEEVARAVSACAKARPLTLVDAAAGKAYVGLLALPLVLAPLGRRARVVVIEREADRVEAARAVASALGVADVVDLVRADVADPAAWPDAPDVVVALHACGEASDHVIARATAARARHVLVAPCCVADTIPAARRALARAEALGLARHAEVRRRFVQAMVDGERALALEAAGYETVVAPFAPPTVTPHHLVFRARRVGEPVRAAAAAARLAALRGPEVDR
jgi:precorrin-6B methylase 2